MIDPRSPDYAWRPGSPDRPTPGYAPADPHAEPTVSIVTPFFNAGEVFDQTVRCVSEQTLQRFEWIIVNDASTDRDAIARLDRMREIDPRIRVIDLPSNSGPGSARNAGFEAARSELVFQLDADDLIEPTALEKFAWMAHAKPEWSFIASYEVGFDAENYLWTSGFHTPRQFLERCPVGAHTVLVRKSAHALAGGYDESIRGGMEDWDFWLRCADKGLWGGTLREYLCWYRRRANHADIWHDWDGGDRELAFTDRLREKYPDLFARGIPALPLPKAGIFAPLPDRSPVPNPLLKTGRRLMLIVPWAKVGGADKFNLDLLDQLIARGWQVTVVCTLGTINPWITEFARRTPDVWRLDHLGGPAIHASVIRGLIESRKPDAVMIAQADEGYTLLPYLRGVCPEPAYVDYSHIEEENWRNGGHPRSGAAMQDLLEMSMVTSEHLRSWMIDRGADPEKTEVAYINVDTDAWKPDPRVRTRVREELGIDPSERLILFAGRLCAQKQPHVLAQSLVELQRLSADSGARWRCAILGDGPDRVALEHPLREAGLLSPGEDGSQPRVLMLGESPSERVRELTAACDICFLPSQWEGIAMVQYEAMATGAVFVGADVGGQRELATPDSCILLPKAEPGREFEDEPPAYASVLHRLALDEERCRAMGDAARARILDGFTLDRMGDRIESLLETAIERAAQRCADPARAWPPARLAHELGVRAVEARRIELASEAMHRRNAELGAKIQQLEQSLRRIEVKPRPNARAQARRQLDMIESTATWKLFTLVKRTPLYTLPARLRWGKDWRSREATGGPIEKLAKVRSGRAYKLVSLVHRLDKPVEVNAQRNGSSAPRIGTGANGSHGSQSATGEKAGAMQPSAEPAPKAQAAQTQTAESR